MGEMNQVTILDCTIRDGGLVNNWNFSIEFVQEVYRALSLAGVDYMEIGYKNSRKYVSSEGVGPWRFCDESLLRETITHKTNTKLSAVVDVGRVDLSELLPRRESLLDLIRVCCYIHEVDQAIELAEHIHQLGYETSINIMAVSTAPETSLTEALVRISRSPADLVYIVDSYGSLYNHDIMALIERFKQLSPGKKIGIHAHNNLQLAFSNTLLGAQMGAAFLDSSIYGMGRAAGNCPTELLVGSMKHSKYDLQPILKLIEERFVPLREQVEWGYLIPYTITGFLNEHPRSAIALRNSGQRDQYSDFYDSLTKVQK